MKKSEEKLKKYVSFYPGKLIIGQSGGGYS